MAVHRAKGVATRNVKNTKYKIQNTKIQNTKIQKQSKFIKIQNIQGRERMIEDGCAQGTRCHHKKSGNVRTFHLYAQAIIVQNT